MAFFEDLGKKLTDAGQNVAQQTKNLADVAQINTQNFELERKITQLQTELGQLYYEKYKDDTSVEGGKLISDINTLKAEIQANNEKINQIKGVVKCEKCGAEVPTGSAFCSSCGSKIEAPVPVTESSTERTCPNCNSIVAEGNAFCNNCGTKLEAPVENIPTVSEEE